MMGAEKPRSDEALALERVAAAAREVQAASTALKAHFAEDGARQPMCSSDIWLSGNARRSFESDRVPELRAPATDAMAIHESGGNHSRSGTPSLRMRRRPVCAQYSAHICIAQR